MLCDILPYLPKTTENQHKHRVFGETPKGKVSNNTNCQLFTAAVDKAAFQLAEHLAARHLSAGLKPREEQMKRMRGAWRLVHNSYEGGGGQSAGKNALSH